MTTGPAPDLEAELNLKQVAARLGVHYMTAYRYVRQGQIPAQRAGTEWRVTREAVETFVSQRARLPTDETAPKPADWAGRLVAPLLDGDEPAAWTIVQRALAAGHEPAYCYLDIIAAAIARIDRQRAEGLLSDAHQPLATAVAYRLTARLGAGARRPGRSRGSVVFGAPLGERHHLPLAIVADLFRLEGFDVLELGSDTAPEAFAAAARQASRLVAVALSVTGVEHLDAAAQAIAAVRRAAPGVPIIVGGQAVLSPEVAGVLDADAWAPDGRQAIAALNRLTVATARRQGFRPESTPPAEGPPRR